MKTFRARLAFWIAASALGVLFLSGIAVYVGVRTTLQEKQDEALLEITRTELESAPGQEKADPTETGATDESLLVWERTTGKIITERGPIALRAAQRKVEQPEFTELTLDGRDYRALYYPENEDGVHSIALCVEPLTPLRSALEHIALWLVLIGVLGAALACFVAWQLATRLTQPLSEIARQAATIQEIGLHQRLSQSSHDAELIAVTDGLNAMLMRLESAFAAQRRFVADAAHELRSPLANLRTTAEVALRQPDFETRERALRLTVSEVERLTHLAESLLTLSLADAGALIEKKVPLDLGQIARESVEAARARADGLGIVIAIVTGPVVLHGDSFRLRQVFDNLLDNALQHAPAGSTVQVGVGKRDGAICASVSDKGSGIAAADLPHVFERLWRADDARARATGGFGLGLAITRAIVEAHGGTIQVSSPSGEGATFLILFS